MFFIIIYSAYMGNKCFTVSSWKEMHDSSKTQILLAKSITSRTTKERPTI